MTYVQAKSILADTPTDAALAVRDAKADLAEGVDLSCLPLDEIFGTDYADAYCRYMATARELQSMEEMA